MPIGLCAALASFLLLARIPSPASRRRAAVVVAELPEALELLAACVRAGLPLGRALDSVVGVFPGPLGETFGRVSARARLGWSQGEAWRELKADPLLGNLARQVVSCLETGTALAPALKVLAAEARRDARGAAESRAKSVGVRSVLPLSLCFLPAFFLVGVVPVVAANLSNLG